MSTTRSATGPDAIAIIGMGCMFPKARNLKEFWRLLRTGGDGITDTPPSHWSLADYVDSDPKAPDKTYCGRGGFLSSVPFDPTEFGIPPTILEATDTSQLLGLVVAKAALEDAGYGEGRDFNRERASVILGVTGLQELSLPLGARLGHPIWRRALAETGVDSNVAEEVVAKIADGYVSWQENSFPGLLGNVIAGRIANRLNLRGTNCAVDAACASSLSAVHLAMMELATGRCDMALAGGVDTLNDIFMYMCFSKTPALSPTGDARPFADDADGTVLGEGIGMLVLKRVADAQRDGDRIYAVIRTIGTSSDGRSQSIYAPHAGGQARCLRNAYELAGIAPDTITLIEAHGTGTTVGDAVEFDALKTVFREEASDGTWCAVGSVKSQIGHTKAAAGAAGLIKAALALHHRALPPTIKITAPNPKLSIEESPFYLNTELRPWVACNGTPRRAGVSSFGFGGSNFHAVLEEHDATLPKPAWDGSFQIVALSAQSLKGLRELLAEWSAWAAECPCDDHQLAWRAASSRQAFDVSHEYRLLFVLDSGADLARLFQQASEKLHTDSAESEGSVSNLHFGRGPAIGQVAFLFPGQGSQYVNMGRELACTFPEMLSAITDVDTAERDVRCSTTVYPAPTFSESVRVQHAQTLARTEIAQPALGAITLGMTRVLDRFGVRPDLVAGHSFGELVALCIAGVYDAKALNQLSRLRGRLMAAGDGDRGTMLAVKAPFVEIERMIDEDSLDVVLANRNAPTQGVLSGTRESIARAIEACRARGWAAKPLSVAGAFHSSLMESALGPFRQALESVEFTAPSIPIFANTTARPYPSDAAASRALLANQLRQPVEFVGQIENIYEAGARTFIEVGPKQVLMGLVSSILSNRPHCAIALDASSGRRSAIGDLAHVLCRLAAEGRPVDLTRWESPVAEPRKPRMVVPLVGANYRAPRAEQRRDSNQSRVEDPPWRDRKVTVSANVPGPADSQIDPFPILDIAAPQQTQAVGALKSALNENSMMLDEPQNSISTHPTQSTSPLLADALRIVQDGIQAMQALQQQTAEAHRRFLEGQEQAHRSIQQLMESQQRLLGSSLGIIPPGPTSISSTGPDAHKSRVHANAPIAAPSSHADAAAGSSPATVAAGAPAGRGSRGIVPSTPRTLRPAPAERFEIAAPPANRHSHESTVLEIVCEKTGYPREMIDLDMDIEADLGIDSIKRVEIVAAVEERIPSFGGIKPEYMGSLRTLREIVAFIAADQSAEQPQEREAAAVSADEANMSPSAPTRGATLRNPSVHVDRHSFSETLLTVVAELTGYPREMLDLSMDLEADLGIDSIKRVEILAAVESRLPNIPAVPPDYMGSLRTLQQIVDYCAGVAVTENALTEAARHIPVPAAAPSSHRALLQRQVLTVIELSAISAANLPIAVGREIWITNDGSPLTTQLADSLNGSGFSTRIVEVGGEIPSAASTLGGLIVVAPSAPPADKLWNAQTESFLKDAFQLAKGAGKKLLEAAADGGALFACITRMDGAFGLLRADHDPAQGGLAGLVKTAAQEWPDVVCRAIDVDREWNDFPAISAAIVRELSSEGSIEVGLDVAARRGLELRPTAIAQSSAPIAANDVFVVTGGARGVTSEAALSLAKRLAPALVLLGRSPQPSPEPDWLIRLDSESDIKQAILLNEFADQKKPKAPELQASFDGHMANRELRRNLARIAETGATAMYRSVDIRDAAAVRAVLEEVRSTLGPIRGLIHAAGVLEDRLIVDKTAEQFANVFDTKVVGLRNLLAGLDLSDLRNLVLFSSVSARFGNRGQADYAMANEVLNKVAQRLAMQLPNCQVRSINWGPWDGGMVSPALKREFVRRGVDLIPLDAGADALVDELSDPTPEVEIILGAGLKPPTPTRRNISAVAKTNSQFNLAFERALDVATHPFLRSHMLAGRPVLPLAITMEWLGHAAIHSHPGLHFVGLDDIRVCRGVALDNGERMVGFWSGAVQKEGVSSRVPVAMRGRAHDGADSLHVSGTAVVAAALPSAPAITYSDGVAENPYPRPIEQAYADVLFHGQHLRGIQKIDGWSSRGMVARLCAAPPPTEWMTDPLRSHWLIDPLILDSAFQMAILWCAEAMDLVSLPTHLASYRQFRAAFPKDGVSAVMEIRERTDRKMRCDITFFDLDAAVVARIDRYECTADASLRASFRQTDAAAAQ